MSRAQAARKQAAGGTDRVIRSLAGVTVADLAGLAGLAWAISYSHMRVLAEANGQAGWHAHAFPLSVDGVEVVASLVLLADRRTGRRSGWLPWTALAIGTAASLAANVSTAGPATISRVIAGWPALALLIAVKLLSGMLEHREGDRPATVSVPILAVSAHDGDDTATGDGDNRTGQPDPAHAVPVPAPVRHPARPAVRARQRVTATSRSATSARTGPRPAPRAGTGTGIVPLAGTDITALLPAARAARDDLTRDGNPVTRDAIATRLRQAGIPSATPASRPSCMDSGTTPPSDHPAATRGPSTSGSAVTSAATSQHSSTGTTRRTARNAVMTRGPRSGAGLSSLHL